MDMDYIPSEINYNDFLDEHGEFTGNPFRGRGRGRRIRRPDDEGNWADLCDPDTPNMATRGRPRGDWRERESRSLEAIKAELMKAELKRRYKLLRGGTGSDSDDDKPPEPEFEGKRGSLRGFINCAPEPEPDNMENDNLPIGPKEPDMAVLGPETQEEPSSLGMIDKVGDEDDPSESDSEYICGQFDDAEEEEDEKDSGANGRNLGYYGFNLRSKETGFVFESAFIDTDADDVFDILGVD